MWKASCLLVNHYGVLERSCESVLTAFSMSRVFNKIVSQCVFVDMFMYVCVILCMCVCLGPLTIDTMVQHVRE